jgi:hypothetical protein
MEMSIKYLVPMLVVFDQKKCFCMVDYSGSKVYFLDESISEDQKRAIEMQVLRKVDTSAVFDVISGSSSISDIGGVLKDLDYEKLRKKYIPETTQEDQSNEENIEEN